MMGQAVFFTVLGAVLGAIPSWFISRMYYLKSGADLDAALRPIAGNGQKLLQAVNVLGRVLQQAGIGKPTYDAAGNLTGIEIEGSAHLTLPAIQLKASGTVTGPPEKRPTSGSSGQDVSDA